MALQPLPDGVQRRRYLVRKQLLNLQVELSPPKFPQVEVTNVFSFL